MDKLKPIIKIIKKYHIWVLCLVLIGTAVGGLSASTGALDKQAATTKTTVEGLNKKISSRAAASNPPNQTFIAQTDQEIARERKRIRRIWEDIYLRQQNALVWPEVLGGAAFLKAVGAPIPEVSFMPTGGVSPDNAADYLSLDNVACVGGSWVAPTSLLASGDFDAIGKIAADAARLGV